jgi:tight adherence protein C
MPTLFIVLFLTSATAIFFLGAATLAPSSIIGSRLRSLGGLRRTQKKTTRVEQFKERVLDPLAKAVPKSPDEVSRTRQSLMMAGYRDAQHLAYYYGGRMLLAIIFPLLAASLAGVRKPIVLLALAVFGYILPRFILKRLIRRRQERIGLSLADALDLSVVCTEAGLGLDQAIQRVSEELKHAHPELSDEFRLINLEMRAGKLRAEALRNVATRTGVDDIRTLVGVLIQTDRFGTSLAQALRVHSDAMRTERRQRAEERAAKTTIKMVPVLVFFIFPSMFIVILGPAFIQLIRNLLPVINQ